MTNKAMGYHCVQPEVYFANILTLYLHIQANTLKLVWLNF
jgi:hypothetical protein